MAEVNSGSGRGHGLPIGGGGQDRSMDRVDGTASGDAGGGGRDAFMSPGRRHSSQAEP